jgi:hypothetical protein
MVLWTTKLALGGAPTEISNKTRKGPPSIGTAVSITVTINANETPAASQFHHGDRALQPSINAIAARAIALHRKLRP